MKNDIWTQYYNKYEPIFKNGVIDLYEQLDQVDYDFYQQMTLDIAENIQLSDDQLAKYTGIRDAIIA